jgi:hypothetical protein
VAPNAGMAELHYEGSVHALRLHPCVEVLQRVCGLLNVLRDVHQVGGDDIAAQISG